MTDRCPVCGEEAVTVSAQSTPAAGPLQPDALPITITAGPHRHDGAAYYHID